MAAESKEAQQATVEQGDMFTPVTSDEVREAVFPNAVENVIFSRLLFELGSDDIAVRAKAARAMAGIHHELSVRALSAQLRRDVSPQVRKECVDALAALELSEGLPAVEEALSDSAPAVRLSAVRGVYRLAGNGGAGLLSRMFKDENELVRCRAATCAGWLGAPELALELLPLLEDGSATVRRAAVEAMGYINSPQAVSALIEHLDDADEMVRVKALEAVRSITGKRIVEAGDEAENDPQTLIARWRGWWKNNRESFSERDFKPRPVATGMDDFETEASGSVLGHHDLERRNKELEVRIKELELQLTSRESEEMPMDDIDDEELFDGNEEGMDIISIVRGLERELDAAFDLKESLEADLSRTQERLASEQSTRHELEGKLELLQAQAALAEQLREEVSFIKEERDVLSRRYDESTAKASRLKSEKEETEENLTNSRKRCEDLQRDRIDLEAQVFNLRDKLKDYAAAMEMRQVLDEKVARLTDRVKVLEGEKATIETELSDCRETIYNIKEENENFQRNLKSATKDVTDLRTRLQEQVTENSELAEANTRFDQELTALRAKHEATAKLLDNAKKSLRSIRSAAMRTTEHFRERYYKPIDDK